MTTPTTPPTAPPPPARNRVRPRVHRPIRRPDPDAPLFSKGVSDLSLRVGATETALIRGASTASSPASRLPATRSRSVTPASGSPTGWAASCGGRGRRHSRPAPGRRVGARLPRRRLRGRRRSPPRPRDRAGDLRRGKRGPLTLPAPDTVVPLRIRGGASELAIRRPANVPVGVHSAAASRASSPTAADRRGRRIDLARLRRLGTATARYDLQLTGGASELCVCA